MNQVETSLNTGARSQTKKKKIRKRWESPIAGYLFISPWLIGFLLLTLWPMIQSVYYSFTDYSLLEAPHWVGAANYEKIFNEDKLFFKSLGVTLWFVAFSVPLKLAFALLVAMFLNQKIKGLSIYRTAI